jgi:hypothetical protein
VFFQGQFLRVKKNIRDDERGDLTFQTVSSVEKAVEEVRKLLASQSTTIKQPAFSQVVGDFFSAAETALAAGLLYPAVLTAAQGYEAALREASQMVDGPSNLPAGQLIRKLARHIRFDSERASTLYRIRNKLVHQTRPDELNLEQASEFIQGFRAGAEDLQTAKYY